MNLESICIRIRILFEVFTPGLLPRMAFFVRCQVYQLIEIIASQLNGYLHVNMHLPVLS